MLGVSLFISCKNTVCVCEKNKKQKTKTGNPTEKCLYKQLIIEQIQMVYKHMKKGSILLVVGKLPIKTTIRC